MKRKRMLAPFLASLAMLQLMPVAPATAAADNRATASIEQSARPAVRARVPRMLDTYRVDPVDAALAKQTPADTPEWVSDAHLAAVERMKERPQAFGISNPETELRLAGASRDDRGVTDVRMRQLHDGLEVFGGQLIAHVDASAGLRSVSGHAFDVANADTTPQIAESEAVAIATKAVGDVEGLDISARLVLVPNAMIRDDDRVRGATLAYQVSFKGEGPEIMRGQEIFVDARQGVVAWRFKSAPHASGIGYGRYAGRSTIFTTEYEESKYRLEDPTAGGSEVRDAGNELEAEGDVFLDEPDNVWGDGSSFDSVGAAVDAHIGVHESWRYFWDRHGRNGADGVGTKITTYVRYGSAYNNAAGADNVIVVGDGDGMTRGSFASIDVMGHEFTHSVVQFSAGLPYVGETGAVDEAMCDIFGTAIEFHSGRSPDYLIGEDVIRNGSPGDAFRDMANPAIDHLSKKLYATGCSPEFDGNDQPTNDYCGVHSNSGIVNRAFHLLAVGGKHPVSALTVPAIGREVAEDIFYVALTRYMFVGSNFYRTAHATLSAATDLYGYNSHVYKAVRSAWRAVGVLEGERPTEDPSVWKTLFYASYDGSAATGRINESYLHESLTDYPAESFSTEWSTIVRLGSDIFYYNYDTGLAAIGHVDAVGNHHTTRVFPVGFFGRNWTHIVAHGGNVFFYNQSNGVAAMGRFTGPHGFTQYGVQYGFSLWWTHILSAQGRLFFYNSNTGISAVGVLDEFYEAGEGFVRHLREIRFRQINWQQLSRGWSHVVETNDGILFYNADMGHYAVGDLDAAGALITRAPSTSPSGRPLWSYSNLGPRWTHIERVKGTILFYDANSGAAMTATMFKPSPSRRLVWGKQEPLTIRQQFTLPSGWTHVVGTIDPTIVR